MSTQPKVWGDHTPVGHQNALYFPSHHLFILVFISDLMIPGGDLDPFPSLLTSEALLFFFHVKEHQESSLLPWIVYLSAKINNYAIQVIAIS